MIASLMSLYLKLKETDAQKGSSFMALSSGVPNCSSTMVCIEAQWSHPDLSQCTPGVGR